VRGIDANPMRFVVASGGGAERDHQANQEKQHSPEGESLEEDSPKEGILSHAVAWE
jgi:hypothetical protein